MPTSSGGLRYPSTGGHTDLALYFQQMTEDIDNRVRISVADAAARLALVSPVEGLEVYEKATKRIWLRTSTGWLYVWGPPGSVITNTGTAGGFANLTGWSITDTDLLNLGNGMAQARVHFKRTGAAFATGGSGNIANLDVCQFPSAWAPLLDAQATGPMTYGRGVWGRLTPGGVLRIIAVVQNTDGQVDNDEEFELAMTYRLANPAA